MGRGRKAHGPDGGSLQGEGRLDSDEGDVVLVAAGVETLVHDDLVDESHLLPGLVLQKFALTRHDVVQAGLGVSALTHPTHQTINSRGETGSMNIDTRGK